MFFFLIPIRHCFLEIIAIILNLEMSQALGDLLFPRAPVGGDCVRLVGPDLEHCEVAFLELPGDAHCLTTFLRTNYSSVRAPTNQPRCCAFGEKEADTACSTSSWWSCHVASSGYQHHGAGRHG